MTVRKVVVPIAGYGTRFLPATRTVPKVVFPVLETSPLHYSVSEAADAGIEQIILVVSDRQESAAAYFDRLPELESALANRGDDALLQRMLAIPDMAEIRVVRQDRPLGLGHAILTARDLVGDEPFAVFLPDDLIWADTPTIGAMADMQARTGSPVLAVKQVPDEMLSSLGIISPGPAEGDIFTVLGLVEKPSVAKAPSDLAIIGRYVLTPDIFDILARTPPSGRGEIEITDAIAALLPAREVYAYRFPGVHFDVGTPSGMLKASVYAALQRDDLAADLRQWLEEQLTDEE